ncbi:hypothetical protein RB597_006005 [Gaeumannomyces tritici]
MARNVLKWALFATLACSAITVLAAQHSKQDAIQVLNSIDQVPGVLITVPPQQHPAARAATGKPAIGAVYQQPLLANVPAPGQAWPLTANPRSASALLGALHRKAAAAAADPANPSGANSAGLPQGYENITAEHGLKYSVPVSVDNVTLNLLVDTGSADLWAVAHDAQCLNSYGWDVNFTDCQFNSTFPKGRTFSYGPITREHMFVKLPNGEMASGAVGYSDTHRVRYPTLFTSMIDQGLVEKPMFGIALGRNGTAGVISWGGMPDVPGLKSASQPTVPVLITQLDYDPPTADHVSFYTIVPDGFNYGTTKDVASHPYIIDTGSPVSYLPPRLSEAINKAFVPTADYNWEYGRYYTTCDATSPSFSVVIGGTAFLVNPADMMIRDSPNAHTGLCATTISRGGQGPYILGAAFLNNVAVGFEVQAAELTFISRPFY